jgi:hypothetical protein
MSRTRLTEQQRHFLTEAEKYQYVTARMFAGKNKLRSAGTFYPTVTMSSAQAVLRRLARRGLLDQDNRNPAIFRINEAGQGALRK